MAPSVIPPSQAMAIQPMIPSFRVAASSTTTKPASSGAASRVRVWTPAGTGSSTSASGTVLTEGSGMADPWVEDGVHDVDEEVDEDVADGDDRHVALQGDVLASEDGVG